MMGPNSVRVLEELFGKYPMQLTSDDLILDLGCGKGLTSLVIAKEIGAKVYANDLWTSAEENRKRFEEFLKNNKASVYFIDKRFYRGVSLIGTMDVLETPEAKERIWRVGDKMYYKEGVTDPDYCVLRFTAIKGRYYSSFKSVDFDIE